MIDDLRELYQEVILDHSKCPRNFGVLDCATAIGQGHNPLCGDEITLQIQMEDERVVDIAFSGQGCAISTAAASTMTEAIKGKTREEVVALFDEFHDMLTGKGEKGMDNLGKLAVFSGVCEFPLRVKCATLAWHTLSAALDSQDAPVGPDALVSTE